MNHGDCMQLKYKIERIIRNEEQVSNRINVLTHYDDDTLQDTSGKFIKIIKLQGLDFVTRDEQTLDAYKNRRNNLLKSFSSDFAMYFWEVRRKVSDFPSGSFPDGYVSEVNARYRQKMKQSAMYANELYLAILTKQPEGFLNKGVSFINWFNHAFDKASKQDYLARRHKELGEVTRRVMSTLSEYDCKLLSVYQRHGFLFSESLEFLSCLINGDSFPIPLGINHAGSILPRRRLFFNGKSGTIEIRSADANSRFGAMLSIKGYSPETYQGLLNGLGTLQCEYVITQSFRFYDRQFAKDRLRDQQSDMLQSKDESIIQADQIDDAFEDTASGEVGYGKHHFTLACYADSLEELNKQVAIIVSKFSDFNISCVREDIACECAFWAQLPGNFYYILRSADISTRNMASLVSLHNYARGKLTDNHWGEAVTVFETLAGTPYYFNFHYKDVGNFLVFGAMGSGKTVLIGFLIAQSMKLGGKRIIFDKDRGLEILVRAMGGVYEVIKPGIHTGFNPCQLDDIPENRAFLAALFRKMLTVNGNAFTEADAEVVSRAIEGMYRLDKPSRQLCHIASFFGAKRQGSLRARFDQWHSDGVHAWLFDNAMDLLDLSPDVIGFDLLKILTATECKTPALMYLTYRVEQELLGKRGLLFIDEGWLALSDDYFKKLIDDWSRTPRKKNNIFGLATQVANDTANSSISKALNESAFCKIFFPNPSADRKVYIEDFGLTEHEYHLIKTLPDDEHYFLLVHGNGANRQSVVIRLNLRGLEDDIAIISGREETLALFDQIRAEVGDDQKKWLPVFHERRKRGNS